jgi:hypothetical protein
VHHLQGKAELVKPPDLLSLLQAVQADKLALYRRHEEGARKVAGYAFNNTYQYVLGREAAHLSWLRDAITGLGGAPAESVEALPVPQTGKRQDADHAVADLMFGECAEHLRFFEQAAGGELELLGRRMDGAGTGDGVLSTRWLE